jgi:hypothetical protein
MRKTEEKDAQLSSGQVHENGSQENPEPPVIENYPAPRRIEPASRPAEVQTPLKAAVTAARIQIEFVRYEDGFVSCPMNLANEVPIVDGQGRPRKGISLRQELHALVDASMDRIEGFQRGEE